MRAFDIGYPHSQSPRPIKKGNRVNIRNKIIAWEQGKEFYDGDRSRGYGGFSYDGRWSKIIPKIIEEYGLSENSSVLEVGSKKGFFLHDLKQALPKIKVRGLEMSSYPIDNTIEPVRQFVKLGEYDRLPFKNNEFDFVMAFASVYILNLKGVMDCLREIQRVGKGKSYISVGAYNTEEERDLFLEWTLLGTTVLHVDEWLEVFEAVGYTGDYYFTTASSLNLVRES